MVNHSSFGRARGDFERASRAAFKTLEKGNAESVFDALALVASAVDRVRSALVEDLRARGATWEEVADVLGCSKQAAWERFRDAV